jgi:hypothetical protein
MFRKLRILILLLILATVGLGAWRANSRLTAWEHTIHVAIYPIAGDDSPQTAPFVAELGNDDFAEIAQWLQEQSDRYGRTVLQPIAIRVASPVAAGAAAGKPARRRHVEPADALVGIAA